MTNKKDMHYILALYGILLGSIVGATVWLFLVTINIGIHFIWGYLPEVLSFPSYYTLCVTIIGGVLVGLSQKHFGTYPRLMPEVMAEYKKNWSNRISLCPSGYFNSDYCFNFRC